MAALAANANNVSQTARQLGIPAKTLENWAKGTAHPEAAKNGEQKKAALADQLEEVAERITGAMPAKIKQAGLQQCAVSLGIAIEKMRLLREQPTSLPGTGVRLDVTLLSAEQLDQLERIVLALVDGDRPGAMPAEPGAVPEPLPAQGPDHGDLVAFSRLAGPANGAGGVA